MKEKEEEEEEEEVKEEKEKKDWNEGEDNKEACTLVGVRCVGLIVNPVKNAST